MLKSLAEDQDTVWKQTFSPNDLRGDVQYRYPCTPTDVKKAMNEMAFGTGKRTDYVSSALRSRFTG
ncbi:hypothetical protein F5Y06DRAFT_272773 [Hypoxylon sp. FL0890]|nr:hypothetical protein F5Y06DRAFT_272773 [Hypoxylon sp. FL0890]